MKKTIVLFIAVLSAICTFAQNYYWVYFTDKAGTEFNPYEYFDTKAIERRQQNDISLDDITDYPLNNNYVSEVAKLSDEVIGETRWFNAVAIYTDSKSADLISQFEFVKEVQPIYNGAVLCAIETEKNAIEIVENDPDYINKLTTQLIRMEGEAFLENKIDGKGIRIAVFDGGFPAVDKHSAFKHIRDDNRIIKTWNFPKNQEDVYGWNTHGTMVLSCIAGINDEGQKIGLATGSEFLLARTEVGSEIAKEEIWWMEAVEWADKNGANIINSSLGYGADRHNTADMDGKKCIVTRAANMAASKGILVCNAMGNEGDMKSWKTLGAPADADSILSIGGIDPETNLHIGFSSFGPTQDGRLKPNVSAFGDAIVVQPNGGYTSASGTSFASPLVAGFAACAWQTKPELTAMQMKTEIEKSADNYPYYDYAIGYGVPQANYFTDTKEIEKVKSFEITEDADYVYIIPFIEGKYDKAIVSYHMENDKGILDYYGDIEFWFGSEKDIKIEKLSLLENKTLMVVCNGYSKTYKLSDKEIERLSKNGDAKMAYGDMITNGHNELLHKDVANDSPSNFGVNAKFYIMPYIAKSFVTPPQPIDYTVYYGKSGSFNYGLRYIQNVNKWYKMGLNLELGRTKYYTDYSGSAYYGYDKVTRYVSVRSVNLEYYQRFRFVPAGAMGFGFFMDLGVYGSYSYGNFVSVKLEITDANSYEYIESFSNQNWHWGIRSRFGYGICSIYGQYRITENSVNNQQKLPNLEMGVELAIPLVR
jgi:subtilisin family serine protease